MPDSPLATSSFSVLHKAPDSILSDLEDQQWARRFEFKDLEALGNSIQSFSIPQGSYIFEEGDNEAFLFWIVLGSVEVVKKDQNDNEILLTRVKRGRVLGEMSILDGEPRSASCRAAQDTEIFVLTAKEFEKLCKTAPTTALILIRSIARTVSRRLRQTSGALLDRLDDEES